MASFAYNIFKYTSSKTINNKEYSSNKGFDSPKLLKMPSPKNSIYLPFKNCVHGDTRHRILKIF